MNENNSLDSLHRSIISELFRFCYTDSEGLYSYIITLLEKEESPINPFDLLYTTEHTYGIDLLKLIISKLECVQIADIATRIKRLENKSNGSDDKERLQKSTSDFVHYVVIENNKMLVEAKEKNNFSLIFCILIPLVEFDLAFLGVMTYCTKNYTETLIDISVEDIYNDYVLKFLEYTQKNIPIDDDDDESYMSVENFQMYMDIVIKLMRLYGIDLSTPINHLVEIKNPCILLMDIDSEVKLTNITKYLLDELLIEWSDNISMVFWILQADQSIFAMLGNNPLQFTRIMHQCSETILEEISGPSHHRNNLEYLLNTNLINLRVVLPWLKEEVIKLLANIDIRVYSFKKQLDYKDTLNAVDITLKEVENKIQELDTHVEKVRKQSERDYKEGVEKRQQATVDRLTQGIYDEIYHHIMFVYNNLINDSSSELQQDAGVIFLQNILTQSIIPQACKDRIRMIPFIE